MSESALVFGPTKSIVGIVSDPPPGGPRQAAAVLILNAGVLHRVGPARIHVLLARALASRGFTSLRFDFSGIGDSPRRESSTLSFTQMAVSEAAEAMDFLARSRGIDRFVLVGICSGADLGLRIARDDPRVIATALVDVYNMPTPWLVLLHSKRQLFKLRSWVRFFSGRSQTLAALRVTALSQESANTSIIPTHADFVEGLRTLADRGTSVFLAFTGGSPAYYHFDRRLRRKLTRWANRDRVQAAYLGDTDHTFTLIRNQKRFVSMILEWLNANVPASKPAAEAESMPTAQRKQV